MRRQSSNSATRSLGICSGSARVCVGGANGTSKKDEVEPYGQPWPPKIPRDASGTPYYSWRLPVAVILQPAGCIDCDIGVNLRAPLTDPSNASVADYSSAVRLDDSMADTQTQVFGITGADTAFDATATPDFTSLPDDVIVAMEVRDSNVECFEPGDYNVADLLASRGKIGDHLHGLLPDRLHVLFADGEVWALDPNAPIADLQSFLTITGAKSHDRDQLLAPHKID
jgi:hypothetical protein